MSNADFVHLHNHTDYSMLDGAAKIAKLVAHTKALGQKAVAITDHGYLFGAYEFYKECKNNGIKPIIGLEAYATPGTSRFQRESVRWGTQAQRKDDVSGGGKYVHMTLLAHSTEGMHNLFRMGSLASIEGQIGKWPRIDRELMERYSTGLISSTGCPSGEVQTRLRLGQYDEAVRAAGELQDIFGKDYFYVELMDHGLEIEKRVRNDLLQIAKDINAPLLATNDAHYVEQSDAKIQDAMLCLNSGARMSDPDRFKFDGTGYYIRPSDEMRHLFADLPEACDNTLRVAEQCNVEFTDVSQGADYSPKFPLPPGEDEHSWFVKEVERGLHKRFPSGIPDDVRKQADYEVSVITQMGFPGYFLVVADFINWAKENGIRVGPGRGSGAGSMVAYVMGITELNPLEHGLMFERFLNPERVSPPDIDVDFDERRRNEVIDYVTEKYGSGKVAQVVTYGTIKTKTALKDSARILDHPYETGEALTKAMPPSVMGKDITVKGIFDPADPRYAEAEQFRQFYEENEASLKPVVDLAKGIEGMTRQWGVHACAVIMSSHELTDVIPVMKREADGAIITQFEFPTCEELGLLKMDFLGLRNLTVISDAINNIETNGKGKLDINSVGLDDEKTFDLLARGDTVGVFQLEGTGMRTLLRQMRPTEFSDISAVGALYRPGPMGANSHTNYALRKNGRQTIEPIHPDLEEPLKEILDETYGLIVYQEQVMAIARKVAGYSLGEADILRRAMGKKKKKEMDQQFTKFSAGMKERGYPNDAITKLWEILVPFSSYAFNKSHSAAYGLVSYWTAYLKANYPVEYMAALLTSTADDKDKRAVYMRECAHMGIKILTPDVNQSQSDFTPVGNTIRFGLSAIRSVGEAVVDDIVAARKEKGNFTSFADFLDKVPLSVCRRNTIECLIKAGAFDELHPARSALVAIHEQAVNEVVPMKRNEAVGQFDLFEGFGGMGEDAGPTVLTTTVPDIPEWDKKTKLGFERQMLGLYVSGHPLDGLESVVVKNSDTEIAELTNGEAKGGRRVTVCGLVTSKQLKTTKKTGNLWSIIILEDLTGSIQVNFFPKTYNTYAAELTQIREDDIISVSGRLNDRGGEITIAAHSMSIPNTNIEPDSPVDLSVAASRCNEDLLRKLKQTLLNHKGGSPVRLHVTSGDEEQILDVDDRLRVERNDALFAELKALLGARSVR